MSLEGQQKHNYSARLKDLFQKTSIKRADEYYNVIDTKLEKELKAGVRVHHSHRGSTLSQMIQEYDNPIGCTPVGEGVHNETFELESRIQMIEHKPEQIKLLDDDQDDIVVSNTSSGLSENSVTAIPAETIISKVK